MNSKEQEMQKAINALYLELPETIVQDIQNKFNDYKASIEPTAHPKQQGEEEKIAALKQKN